jgi:hypothetical protein
VPEWMTTNELMANAGLGHIWAVITNAASYKNIMYSGELKNYKPSSR